MNNKEEILKKLLNNLLESRLKRLENRNKEQIKDLKLEKESYNKQGILLKKLCSVKIEPKKNLKKSTINDNLSRGRDRTPNLTRNRRKNSLNIDDKKKLRSRTPNVVRPRKRPDQKEPIKNEPIKKSKTPLKTSRKPQNSKIPSYMAATATSSNMNKNRRNNIGNKSNLTKKAKTPDDKNKKNTKKRAISTITKDNIENNLKLIDITVDDMKEYISPLEEKKAKIEEKPKEETPKEEKKLNFEPLIENKIIGTISSFLDEEYQYNFFSCNKKLSKYLYEKLLNSLEKLKSENEITSSSTIQDQINALKLKYKSEEFNSDPPKFELSKGAVKAIEMLNNEAYIKIFKIRELTPPLNEILLIYRIFFQLLKSSNIYNIKDDKLFWIEACEYILNNNNGKTGEFFKESINSFDFSVKNIYEIKKIINGNVDKIKPNVYSRICGTTGLLIFLIKDTLEYIGIIHSIKKNIPSIMLKYLEYIGEIQNNIEKYINIIKKFNDNTI